MGKIRVLVVDDAVVFRRLVADELARDPELEVAGTAANGRIALAKMAQAKPDVIILDFEMPEMDGLATLGELRRSYPRLPVIMFSSLTERGAAATLDALAMGATDYFTKPSGTHSVDGSLAVIREQLIPEIKALHAAASRDTRAIKKVVRSQAATPAGAAGGPAPRHAEVVAIGASTGGPNALAEVFSRLPKNLSVPVVVVQHMPPMFTRLMAERMSAQFGLAVKEGTSGAALQPGQVWIAPGDYHMIVVRNGPQARLLLHQDPPQNSCRPAVDVLFRSVAQTFGTAALAIILTGMGQDGLRGCEAVREAGGQVLAQDEATSVVWGMPGNVIRAGLADQVLPISHIAEEILHRVK